MQDKNLKSKIQNSKLLKVLFIGDVVGKSGRRGVKEILPALRKERGIDLVIANIENIAHGKGISEPTVREMMGAGVDAFTSGNHVWAKKEGIFLLDNPEFPILRPANYPPGVPGRGMLEMSVKKQPVVIINLIGRVFMKDDFDDPFRAFDSLLKTAPKNAIIIVDFHAEATSEKRAFGFYAGDRAHLICGTHTHVGTADTVIVNGRAGYVTDAGMTGAEDSILGVAKDGIIAQFLTQLHARHTMVDAGAVIFNSVLAEITVGKCVKIERCDMILNKERG